MIFLIKYFLNFRKFHDDYFIYLGAIMERTAACLSFFKIFYRVSFLGINENPLIKSYLYFFLNLIGKMAKNCKV